MFLYEKKIIYLSRYENGEKKAPAGFVKLLREKDAYVLDIQIRIDLKLFEGEHMLFLLLQKEWLPWEKVIFQNGKVIAQKKLLISHGMITIGERCYKEDELQGFLFIMDEHTRIAGCLEQSVLKAAEAVIQVKKNMEEEEQQDWENEKKTGFENASEDKWEQLQRSYKVVHPFGDARVFLSIEPKDFIVLQSSYQRLVNNSFLLHGFYNYRHLILGPDKNLGGAGNCFYLGVPGTYFEREKMVAVMFGFEGFECDGAVEIGKFGYYMRRVEL